MFGPEDVLRDGTLHTKRRRLVVGHLNRTGPAFQSATTTRADSGSGFVTEEETTVFQAGCSHLVLAPSGLGQCHRCSSWLCSTCSQVRCARCLKVTCVDCSRLLDGLLHCKPCWWRRWLWTRATRCLAWLCRCMTRCLALLLTGTARCLVWVVKGLWRLIQR